MDVKILLLRFMFHLSFFKYFSHTCMSVFDYIYNFNSILCMDGIFLRICIFHFVLTCFLAGAISRSDLFFTK